MAFTDFNMPPYAMDIPTAGFNMSVTPQAGLGEALPNYSFGSLPSGQPIGGMMAPGMPTLQPTTGTIPGMGLDRRKGFGSPAPPSKSSSRGNIVEDVPTCPNPDLVRQRGAERRDSQGGSSTGGHSSLSSEERKQRRQSIKRA